MMVFRGTLGLAVVASALGGTINISTGTGNAAWQVFVPGSGYVTASDVAANAIWAPAPAGTSWVSFALNQSTSCTVGQTPGNGCADANINAGGDLWQYELTLSAAQLGATSGTLSFEFGSDNRVNLFVGNESNQNWGGYGPNGSGFNPLGCSAFGGAVSATSGCSTSIPFTSADLAGDGSLTLFAYNYNDPIPGCPACGNPSGLIVDGTLTTVMSATPEPATFGLVSLAGLMGLAMLFKKRA